MQAKRFILRCESCIGICVLARKMKKSQKRQSAVIQANCSQFAIICRKNLGEVGSGALPKNFLVSSVHLVYVRLCYQIPNNLKHYSGGTAIYTQTTVLQIRIIPCGYEPSFHKACCDSTLVLRQAKFIT